MRTTVTTQAELDAAVAATIPAGDWHDIIITSPAGVWLSLSATPGSASVWAYGSASVAAYDSASVRAYDSASVQAYGSASVRAYDSASVRASGSASVAAYDSASVQAYGSASVRASGSASVRASGSASVRASRYVAVHLYSAHATVAGGVLIDLTALDLNDTDAWVDYTGTERDGDTLTLYKAVRDDYASAHQSRTVYAVGSTVTAPDWRDDNDCGGGLHLSPTPHQAHDYDPAATGFLRCEVAVADWRPIPGGIAKGKAREVRVVAEVDIHGQEIT